jgi:hypothetical protein
MSIQTLQRMKIELILFILFILFYFYISSEVSIRWNEPNG